MKDVSKYRNQPIVINPYDGEDIIINMNGVERYIPLRELLILKYKIDKSIEFAVKNDIGEKNDECVKEFYDSISSTRVIKAKEKKKTRVYLMIDHNTGYYKIGRSNSPMKRERTLQSEKPTIELIGDWETVYREEKALHDYFSDKRVRGEWFALTPDDVEEILSMYETEVA